MRRANLHVEVLATDVGEPGRARRRGRGRGSAGASTSMASARASAGGIRRAGIAPGAETRAVI